LAFTTDSIVDDELLDTLETDTTDADNAEWRNRALRYLQKVVDLVWDREWSFSYRSAQVTVPAGPNKAYTDGRVAAPAGFQRCGMQGGIYPAGRPHDLIHYMNPTHFFRQREAGKRISSDLEFYTVFDFDSASGLPFLFFEPFLLSASLAVQVYYQRRRPTLVLAGGDPIEQFFPLDFDGLLRYGLSDLLYMKSGDARSLEQMSPRFRERYAQLQSRYRQGGDALERQGSRGVRRYGMH
jgi:hypothetical protein